MHTDNDPTFPLSRVAQGHAPDVGEYVLVHERIGPNPAQPQQETIIASRHGRPDIIRASPPGIPPGCIDLSALLAERPRAYDGRYLYERSGGFGSVRFRKMTDEEAQRIAGWRYDPPYDFYDPVGDPDDLAELLDPHRRGEDYFSAFDEKDALVGPFQPSS